VPSSARKVLSARANPRKVGVRDLARWTGRRRTGNAAHRKASGLVRPSVAVEANVLVVAAANALAEGAVKGAVAADAERSQLG